MSEESTCPFCCHEDAVLRNELAYARWDVYPVSPGHLLVIPHRHVADYFELSEEEKAAIWQLIDQARDLLREGNSPDGFNVGFNSGAPAGQTVFHAHVHLIPRYVGDSENPQGGVRGVIPGKQKYR